MTDDFKIGPGRALLQLVHPGHLRLMCGLRKLSEAQPLWKVMDWATAVCNLRVELRRGTPPQSGPLLLIGNDPSPMVAFVVLSTVRREDSYFIGAPGWTRSGRVIAEHCLPVFNVGTFRKYPKEWLRAHIIFRFRDGVKPSQAGRKNIESLNNAADVVNRGGSLAILPAGGTIANAENWKHGVGHIIKKITRPDTQVVLFRVYDTTPRDFARMLNPLWFRRRQEPRVVPIDYAEPFPITELQDAKASARELSLRTKERYLKCFGRL